MSAIGDTPAFDELIDPAEELVQIGSGYEFGEGPVWDPVDGCLLFCDLPGDTRWRWTEERGMEVAMRPAFKAGGLSMDLDGNLVACEHVGSSVTRYTRDGRREVIAYHARGEYLNSPNDIVVRSDGSVYWTDSAGGLVIPGMVGEDMQRHLDIQAVFRLTPDGKVERTVPDTVYPNGLCFSPDEKILYVNDTRMAHIRAFDVAPDGSVSNGRLFHQLTGTEPGVADGMKCDVEGNVYCTGPGGIHVIDPGGRLLGRLRVAGHCTNLAWGDDDWRSLYFTTYHGVHRTRLDIPGVAVW